MNILIGPHWRRFSHDKHYGVRKLSEENNGLQLSFERGNFSELLALLPKNWKPDLILLERPEYLSYPLDIQDSPCPVVAMVGDWNICFRVLKVNLKRFDWIVVDKRGVEVFKKAGYENLDYFPVYSFDSGVHYLRNGFERIYDIVIIGNLNHEFQRDRERWLKRLTSMNSKYKVRILTNIFGEEYPRIYNQARIIFNRSIRGEMNERAYEAPANGALLFYEEENLEIRDFLVPGEECVLYNEDNFEELVDYYLSNEAERQRIADAGNRKIANYNREKLLTKLIEILIERNVLGKTGTYRSFGHLPKSIRCYEDAKLALQEIRPARLRIAQEKLQVAVDHDSKNYEARNALSMVYILDHEQRQTGQDQGSTDLFDKCIDGYIDITEEIPHNAGLVYYNLGFICQSVNRNDLAQAQYEKAVQATYDDAALLVKDHFFPRDYLTFRLEWEKISALHCGIPEEEDREHKKLLRWQCSFLLGGLCLEAHRIEDALTWYGVSAEARPDLSGRALLKTGEVLTALGKTDQALKELGHALALEPFNTEAWRAYMNSLIKAGKYDACLAFCEEIATMIERCPFYETEKSWLIPLRDEAKSKKRSLV